MVRSDYLKLHSKFNFYSLFNNDCYLFEDDEEDRLVIDEDAFSDSSDDDEHRLIIYEDYDSESKVDFSIKHRLEEDLVYIVDDLIKDIAGNREDEVNLVDEDSRTNATFDDILIIDDDYDGHDGHNYR